MKKIALSLLFALLVGSVPVISRQAVAERGAALASGQVLPTWQQVNTDGFGDSDTGEVSALETFDGYLYAGTSNPVDGARIFRSADGLDWTPVIEPGFGIAHDIAPPAILDMLVFNGRLYASTGRGDGPGQIWRSLNGTTWAPMVITGFSDPDIVDITALAEYDGMIYAGATHLIDGAQIWRSYTGDSNTWTMAGPAEPGTEAAAVTGLVVFDDGLFAAIESEAPAQIWRSFGGSDWTAIVSDGFGDDFTTMTGGMAEFAGYLYAGAGNENEGAQLWRTSNGTNWEQTIDPGFGNPGNEKVEAVFVFQNQFYAGTKNSQTGLELWRSTDGNVWEQANEDGFGDGDNAGSNRSNAAAEFLNQLYVGTSNIVDGGELWRIDQLPPPQQVYLYLPSVLSGP